MPVADDSPGRERRLELGATDLARLERLRDAFLAGRVRSPWRDARDLELYDATFARRIAWKWAAVLDELVARGFEAPRGAVLDFGCGSGVASRAWIERFGAEGIDELRLVDAHAAARDFAASRARAAWPALRVTTELGVDPPSVVLASHVIGELGGGELAALLERMRSARWIVWVEPGARDASRALSSARDALLDAFEPFAPCTHASACAALAAAGGTSWCHAFARAPNEVHTDGGWARFGKALAIDLRSLPYSFVALRRRDVDAPAREAGLQRVLGRPRIEKGRALFDACGAEGLRTLRLVARDDPALFERLEEPAGECLLYRLDVEKDRVRRAGRAT